LEAIPHPSLLILEKNMGEVASSGITLPGLLKAVLVHLMVSQGDYASSKSLRVPLYDWPPTCQKKP
jgi:hypothetical protein